MDDHITSTSKLGPNLCLLLTYRQNLYVALTFSTRSTSSLANVALRRSITSCAGLSRLPRTTLRSITTTPPDTLNPGGFAYPNQHLRSIHSCTIRSFFALLNAPFGCLALAISNLYYFVLITFFSLLSSKKSNYELSPHRPLRCHQSRLYPCILKTISVSTLNANYIFIRSVCTSFFLSTALLSYAASQDSEEIQCNQNSICIISRRDNAWERVRW